jgi:hypothetical protein
MPRGRRRSPAEKKRLSLERDHPVSAKYPHAFRKNWSIKKRAAEGGRRTAERVALAADPDEPAPVRRREVRKWRVAPLGEAIAIKQARRAGLREQPRKAAAARERRRVRRGKRSRA